MRGRGRDSGSGSSLQQQEESEEQEQESLTIVVGVAHPHALRKAGQLRSFHQCTTTSERHMRHTTASTIQSVDSEPASEHLDLVKSK